jgi:hypothetical protein
MRPAGTALASSAILDGQMAPRCRREFKIDARSKFDLIMILYT